MTNHRTSRPLLLAQRLALATVFLGAWQVASDRTWIDPRSFSSPVQVARYLRDASVDRAFWDNVAATTQATLWAAFLAGGAGIVIGMCLALMPRLEAVVQPFVDALNAMPRIALAPILITIFGITMQAKVALGFSVSVFVVLASARAGVKTVDQDTERLFSAMGASWLQRTSKLLIPVAVPSIFSGLRLGLIFSLLGVVASEIVASRDGLGQLITFYANTYRLDAVYGILMVLAAVAVIANAGMYAIERRFLSWNEASGRAVGAR